MFPNLKKHLIQRVWSSIPPYVLAVNKKQQAYQQGILFN